LLVAERYLSGARGNARDSSEAARWLWQAVAKQNATASLLLSDLYLRGDGVPKNCDQARLLLDAAARKGMAGAGDRLRNLRAFGCQ
jgi:TPR repeat protein